MPGNPRRENAESIEGRAGVPQFPLKRQPRLDPVKGKDDFPRAVGRPRVIGAGPGMFQSVRGYAEERSIGKFADVALLSPTPCVHEHAAGLPGPPAVSQFHKGAIRFIERLQAETEEIARTPNQISRIIIKPADVKVA